MKVDAVVSSRFKPSLRRVTFSQGFLNLALRKLTPGFWAGVFTCILLVKAPTALAQPWHLMAPQTAQAEQKGRSQRAAQTTRKININRATLDELQTLPGIGPVIAQRIVDYRKKNPPFRKVEELLIIRGISQNKLEKIRDRVSVD